MSEQGPGQAGLITSKNNYEHGSAKTNWDEIFIRIDRQFTNPASKFHLSVRELYVFILLKLSERKDQSIFTCIHMLEESSPLNFYKKGGGKNRKEISDTLLSLIDKEILLVSGEINCNKPYTPFYARINHSLIEKEKDWKGFNKLFLNVFQKAKRPEHLYMYCVIMGYRDGFSCSYTEWTKIINRSTSSVKRYVKEVVEDGYKLFEVNYGKYLDGSRNRQERNIYKITDFKESEKTRQTKLKEKEKNKESVKQAFGDYEEAENIF